MCSLEPLLSTLVIFDLNFSYKCQINCSKVDFSAKTVWKLLYYENQKHVRIPSKRGLAVFGTFFQKKCHFTQNENSHQIVSVEKSVFQIFGKIKEREKRKHFFVFYSKNLKLETQIDDVIVCQCIISCLLNESNCKLNSVGLA